MDISPAHLRVLREAAASAGNNEIKLLATQALDGDPDATTRAERILREAWAAEDRGQRIATVYRVWRAGNPSTFGAGTCAYCRQHIADLSRGHFEYSWVVGGGMAHPGGAEEHHLASPGSAARRARAAGYHVGWEVPRDARLEVL